MPSSVRDILLHVSYVISAAYFILTKYPFEEAHEVRIKYLKNIRKKYTRKCSRVKKNEDV
jgi:hypothetical protein